MSIAPSAQISRLGCLKEPWGGGARMALNSLSRRLAMSRLGMAKAAKGSPTGLPCAVTFWS